MFDEPKTTDHARSLGSMAGRICLITGATSGIGAVTARELCRRGATVVLAGRNRDRCAAAAETIARETGRVAPEFLCADLSSLAEVRRLAGEFLARHDRLHVLINNAGALFALRQQSVDGVEMTFALNHLGPFLLTNLLLETLIKSAPSRIINVSSRAHKDVGGFDFDDPQALGRAGGGPSYPRSELSSLFYTLAMPWAHPGFAQYARTKLANLLFTRELARRLEGSGVTVNALHPGLVATGFSDGNGVYGFFMRRFVSLRAITAEQGADTLIYLATSPEVQGVTGQYFVDRKPVRTSPAAEDAAAARRLWQLSEDLTAGHGK